MSLELSRRLIDSLVLDREVVARAWMETAACRAPFLKALLDASPDARSILERELERVAGSSVDTLTPSSTLVARLPPGLCSWALAFPAREASEGGVDVVSADPWNRFAEREFAFHLKAHVHLVRGSIAHVMTQVAAIDGARPSASPRKSSPAAPVVPTPTPPARPEPVEWQPPAVAQPPADYGSGDEGALWFMTGETEDVQGPVNELTLAATSDMVVDALVAGMTPLCQAVHVFTVRGGKLQSRARLGPSKHAETCSSAEFVPEAESSLAMALAQGQHMGPPRGGDAEWFAGFHEVCAVRVSLGDRPLLVLACAGFASPFEVSRRGDRLARGAAEALGRILRGKKR